MIPSTVMAPNSGATKDNTDARPKNVKRVTKIGPREDDKFAIRSKIFICKKADEISDPSN